MLILGRRPSQLALALMVSWFPYWLGPTRKCEYCEVEFQKEQGVNDVYGWFCNEDHAAKFWQRNQH